jgi:hypothetical protein
MNLALLFGLFRALFKNDGAMWKRIERSSARAEHHNGAEHNGAHKPGLNGQSGISPAPAIASLSTRSKVNELSP